jgi:hypothetical protein
LFLLLFLLLLSSLFSFRFFFFFFFSDSIDSYCSANRLEGQFTINDPTFSVNQDYESRLKRTTAVPDEGEGAEEGDEQYRNAE